MESGLQGSRSADEPLSRSYPAGQRGGAVLPASALGILLEEEQEDLDISACAHAIAQHTIPLLKDPR